jgi:hypothetical protein
MGAAVSALVSESQQAKVQSLVQETIQIFSNSFVLSYKSALIDKIKVS